MSLNLIIPALDHRAKCWGYGASLSLARGYTTPRICIAGFAENSMGNARPRIKLLAEKLLLIRQYLNVSQSVMAQLLEVSKTDRVSQYEDGVREPNLMVTLGYSRLGKVSMTSLVDDDVSANEFRKQLGKFELVITKQDGQGKQSNTQNKKPVTLISGSC
jgi:DNA-binding XRE family transcriptional regulator